MAAGGGDLSATFKKFGTKGTPVGSECTTKDVTRWLTDAGVLGKNNSSNNLDIAFSAVKTKGKPTITAAQMPALIKRLAPAYAKDKKKAAKVDQAETDAAETELTTILAGASPKAHGTTKTSKTGGVEKQTDTSKYTGSHKERFGEDGKGKGAEGRTDKVDNTGYVGNYKGEGTHDKKK